MNGSHGTAGPEVHIVAVDPRSKDSIELQWEMRRELDLMYDEVTLDPPPVEQFMDRRAVFTVAMCEGKAVGCGAFTVMDATTAQIKRVYVRPHMRRKGVGRLIMRALETYALERGYERLFLETADKQSEAIRMYLSLGYRQVPCDDRMPCSDHSICFERTL